MQLIEIRAEAGENEIFHKNSFKQNVGKKFSIKVPGKKDSSGKLISYKIIEDGKAILLRLEVPDGTLSYRSR